MITWCTVLTVVVVLMTIAQFRDSKRKSQVTARMMNRIRTIESVLVQDLDKKRR